ncbi:hypothetical protein J1N35_028293 [Gossypium stocksii]|uniref:Uncharacterized protein n=1 Tax=Gossypium stocksii TaxID=47602 RepID=A0A9D3ZQZ3_9ROSI|nr:hypothetical protein J1N35_028293 [Gossypium stocksii]
MIGMKRGTADYLHVLFGQFGHGETIFFTRESKAQGKKATDFVKDYLRELDGLNKDLPI